MARPELVLAGLLIGLTLGVLFLWPAQVPVPVLLRVLGAWVAAFILWVGYACVEWAVYERRNKKKKLAEALQDSSRPQ